MRKFKNFSFLRKTSKLYSENNYSKITPKLQKNSTGTIRFLSGQLGGHVEITHTKDTITESDKMRIESDLENQQNNMRHRKKLQDNPTGKLIILYRPLVALNIFNLHDNFTFNFNHLCTEWNSAVMKKAELNNCTAVVPWLYNSRALVPYNFQPSHLISQKNSLNSPAPELSRTFTIETSGFQIQDQSPDSNEDCANRKSSKFAMSLNEILEETKDAKGIIRKNDKSFDLSKNCKSCPAVMDVKGFSSKFTPRRKESKVLLLSCHNFEKFEKTFTRLLAKDKIRSLKPLFRNFENQDQVMTKLEKAFVNHKMRRNNNDVIKKNVIILQSNLIEDIKEQLDFNQDSGKYYGSQYEELEITNLNMSNGKVKNVEEPSNIMIVNDEIFKGLTKERKSSDNCDISDIRKQNMIYLNNSIFKELSKEEVNKILSRQYTSYKNEDNETFVRIPTRNASKKFKSLRPSKTQCDEHEEIPLENLIKVVAEKKRTEYVQRSKMCWQVFKDFEETMQKAKILNFPTQDQSDPTNKQKATRKIEKHECNNSAPPLKPRTQKRPTREKEEYKSGPNQTQKDFRIKATPNKSRVRSENTLKPKVRDKQTTAKFIEIMKKPTVAKSKTKETKLNNTSKSEIRSETYAKVGIRNVNTNILTTERSIKKVGNRAQSSNKKCKSSERNQTKDSSTKPQTTAATKHKIEKLANSPEKKSKPETKYLLKKGSGRLKSIWRKECTPKKEMEEFINIKKDRNLSLKQQHLLFKEDENPVIEVLHKNAMESPLSSSQSEFIGELIETPKKKKMKRLDKISRTIMGSNDLADETETKLVIEELLESSIPPIEHKNFQHTAQKHKSKIPILGTPTTIKKHIEKVVATALATKKIREKFDENEIDKTEKRDKSGDSVEDINNESVDVKLNPMESKDKKTKYMDSMKEMKEIEKDNRLQIDEILAMNSTSINEKLNQKFKNDEVKNEKEIMQLHGAISEEQEKTSLETTNLTESNETDRKNNGEREDNNAEYKTETLGECEGIQRKFPLSSTSNTEKPPNKAEKIKIQTVETKEETGNSNEKSNTITAAPKSREVSLDLVKESSFYMDSKKKFDFGFKMEGKTKMENISNEFEMESVPESEIPKIKNQSTEFEMGSASRAGVIERKNQSSETQTTSDKSGMTENYSEEDEKQIGKQEYRSTRPNEKNARNVREINSNDASHEKNQVQVKNDSNANGTEEEIHYNLEKNGENFRADIKSTDDGSSMVPDNEVIRRKRLIYFGKRMKKSSPNNGIRLKIKKSRSEVEKTNKRNLSKPEIFIANKSELNSTTEEKTDADKGDKLPMREHLEESKSLLSQYKVIKMSDNCIETESDHKNTFIDVKNEIGPKGRQKTADHKIILKQSVSDNVIIIKAARKDSKETVKSTQSATKTFLKQVQQQLNFLMEHCKPRLNNQAVKRCREIAVKLRKSQEKLMRNVPASIFKVCQEAKKIRNKFSSTNIITERSQENVSKFTNTHVKQTTDSASQAKLREIKKLSYKPEIRVKSAIESKVTTKMKLLRKTPTNKNGIQKKNSYNSGTQDEKYRVASKGKGMDENLSPSISISDVRNRSIGSLFADTVASALAKCGEVDKIMNKYSDYQHRMPIRDRKMNRTGTAEDGKDFAQRDEKKVVLQKEDEFLMSDGVRKLVFHVTLEKNEHKTDGEEWKCFSKAVLVKKSNESRENQVQKYGFNQDSQTKGSTKSDIGTQRNSKVPYSILDDTRLDSSHKSPEEEILEVDQNADNISKKNFDGQEEADALQKTKEDLTALKMLLQKERAKNEDDNSSAEAMSESNIQDNDVPESLEDLHRELISDRLERTTEGSTSPPPPVIENIPSDEEKISNKKCLEDSNASQKSYSAKENEDNVSGKPKDNLEIERMNKNQDNLKFGSDESTKETIPEIFVTPLTSSTDLTDQVEVKPVEYFKVSELIPLFDKTTNSLSCRKTNIDQSLTISNVSSEKSFRIPSPEGEEKLTRKEEIERSCKLSNHPNSLVCRERKTIVKTILDKCESLEQKVENVLNNGSEVQNLKEIYTDLQRMGNCILKTVSSKDELCKETCAVPKINANKNTTRTFATVYSSKSYSRFRDRKPEGKEKKKEEDEDFKVLEEIHGEALENEMYFGTESRRRKREPQQKNINYPKRNSIYHEIVRMSELNDFEVRKSKENGGIDENSHFSAIDTEQQKLEAKEVTKLDQVDSKGDKGAVKPETLNSEHDNRDFSPNTKSQTLQKERAETFLSDDTSETVVFEVKTSPSPEEFTEQKNANDNDNENPPSETAEQISEKQNDNFEKGDTVVIRDVDQKVEEQASAELSENTQPLPRKHKILEKFAAISQEPDSSIFRINDDLTFDRAKKRFEKRYAKTKRNMSKRVSSKRDGEPRMIIRLTPSKELYTPPKSKKSDIDLKRLLIENPKTLMQIASQILSKNQYLKFLVELRSTKELKEYWMTKIKEGIASSKTLKDITTMINYMKDIKSEKTDSVERQQKMPELSRDSTEKLNYSKKSETETRPVTRESSDLLSSKSDIGLEDDKTSLELEMDNQKPKSGQSNFIAKRKKMLKKSRYDASSRRNISFQHKDTYDHPEFGSLPYTLAKYLDSPIRKDEIDFVNPLDETDVSNFLHIESLDEKELSQEEIHGEEIEYEMKIDYKKEPKKNIKSELENEEGNDYGEVNQLKNKSILENNGNGCHHHQHLNICYEILDTEMDRNSNQGDSNDGVNEKKEQQTAIVLPGREPMKISLISEQFSSSPPSSMKDNSENNALENLSDVLSNCSSPVSSLCSEGTPNVLRRTPRKPGIKRTHRGEILNRNSTYEATNLQKSPQRSPTTNGLNLRKIDYPWKKFVRNHDEIHKSKMIEHLPDIEESPEEERKIRVIKTKSLSEVLKEDPNILKKYRQKTMVDVNPEQTEEATKRFEYRFHDFRKKEDKCLEMNTKRQEEQKKDLLQKFKCLIQARKVATERTRQNIKQNENQPIQPKVFSKILEKINYFKELEDHPDDQKKGETIASDKNNSVSPNTPKTKSGNRRFLHTKRKQVNEDELVTWVQEHPAAPEKKIVTEKVDRRDAKKQNVIHIPWTPTCEVNAKN